MKTWISFLWILTVVLAPQAGAALTSEELAQIPAINHLTNGGFENGAYSWVASGGATKTVNSTAKANNNSGYDWDSNGASQTLRSATIPIPNALKGRNAVLSCLIKGVASGSTHTVTVDDGSGNPMFTAQTIVAPTNTFKRNSFNFPMNSSGNFRVEFKSVAADEPELYIDDCGVYEADKFNLSQVNQSEIIGTVFYPQTSGCSWTFSGTSYGAASAQSSCPTPTVTGVFNTSAGKIPGGNISQLPPGNYEVIINAVMLPSTAGSPAMDGSFTVGTSVSDSNGRTETGSAAVYSLGTGSSVPTIPQSTVVGFFYYLNAQSNVTLQMKGKTSNASNPAVANNSTASYTNGFLLTLKRFPLSSETAYRPDTLPASWSGTSTLSGTTSSSSYADPGSITGAVTTVASQNLTCTAASGLLGITCSIPRAGVFQVCYGGWASNSGANSSTVAFYDGANNLLAGDQTLTSGGAGYGLGFGQCAHYSASGPVSATFKVRAKVISGTVTVNPSSFSVTQISQSLPAPILVGSVTSNTSGTERIERLRFTNAGTPTIASQSGSWVSSLTDTAQGQTTVNIAAGMFSATPSCTCNASGAVNQDWDCNITETSSTSVLVRTVDFSTNGYVDIDASIICMGPR